MGSGRSHSSSSGEGRQKKLGQKGSGLRAAEPDLAPHNVERASSRSREGSIKASKRSIHQPDDVLEGESPSRHSVEMADRKSQQYPNRSKSGERNAKRRGQDSAGASMEFDEHQLGGGKVRSKSNNKIQIGKDREHPHMGDMSSIHLQRSQDDIINLNFVDG